MSGPPVEARPAIPASARPLNAAERASVLRVLAVPADGWAPIDDPRARGEKRWHAFVEPGTNRHCRQDVVTGNVLAGAMPRNRHERRAAGVKGRRR